MEKQGCKFTKSKLVHSEKKQKEIPCEKCDASIYLPDFGFVHYLEYYKKKLHQSKALEIE